MDLEQRGFLGDCVGQRQEIHLIYPVYLLHFLHTFHKQILPRDLKRLGKLVDVLVFLESGVLGNLERPGRPHDDPVIALFLDLLRAAIRHLERRRHLLQLVRLRQEAVVLQEVFYEFYFVLAIELVVKALIDWFLECPLVFG